MKAAVKWEVRISKPTSLGPTALTAFPEKVRSAQFPAATDWRYFALKWRRWEIFWAVRDKDRFNPRSSDP